MKLYWGNNKVTVLCRIIRILKELDVRGVDYPDELIEELGDMPFECTNMTEPQLKRFLMLAIVELTY